MKNLLPAAPIGILLVAITIFTMAYMPVNENLQAESNSLKTGKAKLKITGIKRLENTVQPVRGQGDNWYMTWASDDKQYAGLCDGVGFKELPDYTGISYNSQLYTIAGDPPDHTFELVPAYPYVESVSPRKVPGSKDYSRYYGFGILAVGDNIYQLLSTPKVPFGPEGNAFIGGKFIHSPDNGKTWFNQDGSTPVVYEKWEDRTKDNMAFFYEPDESFSLHSFLQMGKAYEDNKDGYAYLYAPNGNVDGKMNQLVMLRVKKDKILDRNEYEYFESRATNGSAKWVKDINKRGIVHEFPKGWVNYKIGPGNSGHPYSWQPTVVYNKPLGVYMMANWGIGVGSDGDWFGKPSYFGFYTAPQPWGPWTQVHEEKSWTPAGDNNARTYQPVISPKWIAKDGKSFWLVWTDFRKVGDGRPYYAFNCQKVEIKVE
ncbi:MAG: hypothetical protein ABIR06_20420 [Cyclobacteriaceae bacterium]